MELALERELSKTIMGGRTPVIREIASGDGFIEQGAAGTDTHLVSTPFACRDRR